MKTVCYDIKHSPIKWMKRIPLKQSIGFIHVQNVNYQRIIMKMFAVAIFGIEQEEKHLNV